MIWLCKKVWGMVVSDRQIQKIRRVVVFLFLFVYILILFFLLWGGGGGGGVRNQRVETLVLKPILSHVHNSVSSNFFLHQYFFYPPRRESIKLPLCPPNRLSVHPFFTLLFGAYLYNARSITLSTVFKELYPFFIFAIKSMSGEYLRKYTRELNET